MLAPLLHRHIYFIVWLRSHLKSMYYVDLCKCPAACAILEFCLITILYN